MPSIAKRLLGRVECNQDTITLPLNHTSQTMCWQNMEQLERQGLYKVSSVYTAAVAAIWSWCSSARPPSRAASGSFLGLSAAYKTFRMWLLTCSPILTLVIQYSIPMVPVLLKIVCASCVCRALSSLRTFADANPSSWTTLSSVPCWIWFIHLSSLSPEGTTSTKYFSHFLRLLKSRNKGSPLCPPSTGGPKH